MIELAGGAFVFLAVVIVLFVGVVIALFTEGGSGMTHHPYRHVYGGAPGADTPCQDFSGSDRTSATERDVVQLWRRTRDAQDPAAIAAWIDQARARRRRQVASGQDRRPV
jgi:hypothetical protein